jgi:histidine triad (HIT) family protein
VAATGSTRPATGVDEDLLMSCLFCGIVAGDVPATVVRETERTVAFRDLNPGAPTHVLVVPRDHYANAAELAAADPAYAGEVLAAATAVAEQEGLTGGYRIVTNTGDDAGQSVQHLHLHVLGGRPLGWPPG